MFKEWKAVLKKPTFLIVMLGIALIPALYNVIFLSSMWDPYDKVENLPVAVVNQDVKASYQGKEMAIGDNMVEKLKKQKGMDWQFVDAKKAKEGLADGDYYMVVTLPAELSKQAASILSDQPQEMVISYEVSSGHSFIASKMSDSAMEKLKTSVAKQVTTSYNEALFDNMDKLKDGITTAADGSTKLSDGMVKLKDGSTLLSTNLDTLANSTLTFASGADRLSTGLVTYTDGVAQLADGASLLASKSDQLVAGGQALSSAAHSADLQSLVDGSAQLAAGLSQIDRQLQANPISEEDKQALANLSAGLTSLETALSNLPDKSGLSGILEGSLTSIAGSAQTILTAAQADKASILASVQATSAYQGLSAEGQTEITNSVTASASQVETEAQSILTSVASIKSQLPTDTGNNTGSSTKDQAVAAVSQINGKVTKLNQLVAGYDQLSTIINTQVAPGATQVAGGVATLQGQLQTGADQLSQGINTYTGAVGQIADGSKKLNDNSSQLVTGSQTLSNGAGQIADGSGKLAAGGLTLSQGLDTASLGSLTLSQGLTQADSQLAVLHTSKSNAQTLASPASLKRTDKSKVGVNGVAMAPYMISVALFVAAISTNTIFAKLPSGRNPKSKWDWFKARAEINGLIALVAGLLVYGAVHLLGLSANFEVKTLVMVLLSSLTSMALVTALTTWNSKVGAFFSLILLLLQLASSAGTYPIELTSTFYQFLNPFLPMSYSVSGLRETISMNGSVGLQFTVLAAFLILFLGLGMAFYKPEED